jgi:hypothetical protein
LFSGPPPAEPQFPQSYNGFSQLIHCVICNRRFNRHESLARHQREAHPSEPGIGSKHTASEALPADQSSGRNPTWDRQPSEEKPLPIVTTFEEANKSEVAQRSTAVIRGTDALQQRLRDCPINGSTNHKLYTKAAIVLAGGIVELARVKIDRGSLYNLLPRSIASRLGLPLHFGSSIRVRVANHTALTNQYCRLTIKVAGIETAIDTCVVSELSSLLLGWEWTQQVNLLSDYRHYIPGPYRNLNELPLPGPIAEAKAETEFAKEGEIAIGAAVIREMAEEVPTALRGSGGHGNEGYEFGELASVDASATGEDKTISDAEFFANAVSHQSSDDDDLY